MEKRGKRIRRYTQIHRYKKIYKNRHIMNRVQEIRTEIIETYLQFGIYQLIQIQQPNLKLNMDQSFY